MSIVELVKEMIHDQNIPMFLWAEASNTTIYIQNKSLHWILEDKSPEEAFIGVNPKVNHMKIFGCPVNIHVPKEKRTKPEPSRKEGTIFGCSETSKSYIIYIQGQCQIEVSHDVTFNGEITLRRSK
jgi:hypothetical protein